MKCEEVYGRTLRGELSQAEAAEMMGMSERTFRRWRGRFEEEGTEGLYDRLPARRKDPRRALPGMMLHQDGSRHEWVVRLLVGPDRDHGRRHERGLLGLSRRRGGTMSSFRALSEVISERGRFCSLYADRATGEPIDTPTRQAA